MWPLCFLLNKFLRVEERNQGRLERHGDSTSDKYFHFDQYRDAELPSSSYMEVPHVHQLASWDCGLACVLMVLRASGITSCTIEDLTEICSTNSVWTVDLAYLLQKFCVEFSYYTITFGANPNYSIEEFYKCRSVSIHEISCLLLSGNYIAIALVDQDKLSKSWLEEVIVAGLHNNDSSYTGHYIVICGYDAVRDEFEIRDPASSKTLELTKMEERVFSSVHSTVFKESESLEGKCDKIEGYDFNQGVNYKKLLRSMLTTGFQASNLGEAIDTVNQMLDWRLADETVVDGDCSEEEKEPLFREKVKCKIFLGFTSNLVSSGVRDTIRYLVQHHMVDVIVTTTGGVEEDLIKCLAPTYKGDFSLPGAYLRSKGLNRIGNLLVPNDNYCKFEDWIIPIFDEMLKEQKEENVLWTPSKLLARLGKEINNESSYLYWAYKMNIPVFCPGLTDGSLGDMLYFHSFRTSGLIIDVVQDIRAMNGEAVHATPRKTGMIILGGGLPKHHICNANMMRNGADYAVFINTGQEFDGSDSGARPDEAVSWGKIRGSAKMVKVYCDATIAFPLLVAETFASKKDQACEPKT